MKKFVKTMILAVPALILLTACENKESDIETIEGTYSGILFDDSQLKNTGEKATTNADTVDATAEVVLLGERMIELHRYGTECDTTFTMNYCTS